MKNRGTLFEELESLKIKLNGFTIKFFCDCSKVYVGQTMTLSGYKQLISLYFQLRLLIDFK